MTLRTLPACLLAFVLLQGCSGLPAGHGREPDPTAAVPPQTRATTLEPSPLSVFRSGPSPDVQGWREANDTVGRIGGWRAYTQEAQAQPGTPSVLQDSPRTSAPLAPLFGSGSQPVPGA